MADRVKAETPATSLMPYTPATVSRGGTDVAIKPSMLARIMAGAKYVATGKGDWFGPGEAAAPVAPESVAGRQFNYATAVNLTTATKTVGLSFDQLRQVSEACDVIRTLIETRKDQMCGFGWLIKPCEEGDPQPAGATKPAPDPRIKELTTFFKSPDKQHTWAEWLRMLLEDLFVIDAPTLYVQRDFKDGMYALHPIDGGTIKRLIDQRGWTPAAPAPAYQQILRGMPAVDYTTDELIYKPRNPRTHRIYGYSPVEQIIVTAQLLLSRQASNLEFYQSGNLPEGFLQGGKDWTPEQVGAFQEHLDILLSANFAERRKARVVPGGSTYQPVKEPALKSDFDEWLARIACFAFSYPPSAFTKDMNRATSESAKQAADEEGVNPLRHWVKDLIDSIIQTRFGYADLEFTYEDKEAQDPLERATIDQIYLAAKVITADEVRSDLGRAALSEDQKSEFAPPPPPVVVAADPGNPPAPGESQPANPPAKDEKKKPVAKGYRIPKKRIDHKSAVVTNARSALTGTLTAALSLAADEAGKQLVGLLKAGGVDKLKLDALNEAANELSDTLTDVAKDGAQQSMTVLNIDDDDILDTANEGAIKFANKRAGELIKSGAHGGELAEGTRTLIRGTVEDAIAEGWSPQRLKESLKDSYAFSSQRAETIARTEVALAHGAGSMAGYRASGVVEKKVWLLADDPCPICEDNAADGEIALDDEFSSGDDTEPAHPNCECDVGPVVSDDYDVDPDDADETE